MGEQDLSPESLTDLLAQTSRTFALAIPLLPEPTRRTVSLSYLLFRIADTLEDAATWSPSERVAALESYAALVAKPDPANARRLCAAWLDAKPTTHAGYLHLLAKTEAVLGSLDGLAPAMADIVRAHVTRTALGMRDIVAARGQTDTFALTTLDELRSYCYVVAGIVGELLTETFVHDCPLLGVLRGELESHARQFGEALQLVNILKDEHEDAREGRIFLPASVPRAQVYLLAQEDLRHAALYKAALVRGGAPRGIVAFVTLPYNLASMTLAALEKNGPGAKVPRDQVMEMFAREGGLS